MARQDPGRGGRKWESDQHGNWRNEEHLLYDTGGHAATFLRSWQTRGVSDQTRTGIIFLLELKSM
jgi:hypothetical protein